MKQILCLIILVSLLSISCKREAEIDSTEKWKQEIVTVEQEFAAMAAEKGIPDAFLTYAAKEAVLMRNNKLVKGVDEIAAFFGSQPTGQNDVKLSWKPEFVDVASSGDLGYTYGHYTYSFTDSTGTKIENTGIFHTVWKRQPDGTWRFVWD